MKKRNTVLLLGITSIIILISVQVFIIIGIWKQKNEMFALRYTMLSKEALTFINRRMPTDGFDTVRFLLTRYSEQANKELHAIKDEKELTSKEKDILDYFTKVVNQEQDLSGLLSSYFERRGFEKKFNYSIVINNLEMISNDTIIVYRSEDFANRRSQDRGGRPSPPESYRSKILVNWFGMEDNNYRLIFDYFIDFSDKQKVILKETSASLGMSTLSILLVGIMFMITYRNLMEEKRLSNLKTDFINNMTHELKTPLSTITVAGKTLEMVQIRNNDAKILETAKLIGKQSVHLNQLINMILEISMWERTQFQLDKKTIDIEELMNDVVDSFKSGGGDGATINQKYNFSGAKVDLDVIYFTTLINNLLSNAVKYSDKDPVIEIEGFTSENNICIKVADNGIGINKLDQKHVFDKFYRASTGNIHKFKGLGLGLYYVKKIAEAHGGDVTVSCKPGKGSIFTLTMPY
ncbi:MAG: HAMP domain-containing sensor histidine kinase [Bacteroidia bacterium]|nr:HAMP domain-containing sensor histidine kinase [Bacteroidia bacterium]